MPKNICLNNFSHSCFKMASFIRLQNGHPSLPLLQKLCPRFSNLSSLDCESYQFAKYHRLSSRPRVNKRDGAPFELVHSDVWGPCPVLSPTRFRYFVTFVDDYS